jgi:hypothetical protein
MKDPYVVRKLKAMLSDITYCVSKSCPKADKCDRWWLNNAIPPWADVSMFNPYKKGKRCEYYINKK